MKGYLYLLLVVSICGAVCSMLAWGGFERYIKYIASLICLVIMISPFREIDISAVFDNFEVDSSEKESSSPTLYSLSGEMTEINAEEYISSVVFSRFGIKTVGSDIKIDWSLAEPIIEEITVTLSSEDYKESDTVSDYLSGLLGGEVKIIEA